MTSSPNGEAALRRAIAMEPASHPALQALYAGRFGERRFDAALSFARRALALAPMNPDDRHNLAEILARLDRHAEAVVASRRTLSIDPQFAEAWQSYGVNLQGLHSYERAVACYDHFLALRQDREDVLVLRLTAALSARGAGTEVQVERLLLKAPKSAKALMAQGCAFQGLRRYPEAATSHRRALAADPDVAENFFNLAEALASLALGAEAARSYRRALSIQPTYATAHSNLIFLGDFLPDLGFAEHQAERRRWSEAQRRGVPLPAPHGNSRDRSRPLRLGYVSSDFFYHSATAIFEPVLRHHDRSGFELFLYSGVVREDDKTREFRSMASVWRPTVEVAPEVLARQIRADGIDILVDLSGHTANNHLLTFLRKPSPVQVTAWGHATGTGLPEIDYLFADPVIVPEEVRPLFAERIYDLPCFLTCDSPVGAPEVAPAPALATGTVTFGCFNRASKVSVASIEAWARILGSVPGSRLVFKDRAFDVAATRSRFLAAFARLGIEAGRIVFRGGTSRRDHLAAYADVDICLDPFPANGGVTTCETLFMGVPVLALLGRNLVSRSCAAILAAAGLGDWIAADVDAYVALATEKAAGIGALATLRRDLRRQFLSSPVGNPVAYTHAVEAAYRDMWRRWCTVP